MTATAALVLARSAGFVARAPGMQQPGIAAPMRALFAVVLTIAIAPGLAPTAIGHPVLLLVAIAIEAAIGAALGTSASLALDAAYAAGRAVDDYTGIRASLGAAANVSPAGFGRLFTLVATVAFFAGGAYGPTIAAYAQTFAVLPPGAPLAPSTLLAFAPAYARAILVAILTLSAPAFALALVAQFGFAALARVVPRLGAFPLAFPLVFALGLIAALASLALVRELGESAAAHAVPLLR